MTASPQQPSTVALATNKLVEEYVNRWYLSEPDDTEADKVLGKSEMTRELKALINSEIRQVLDRLESLAYAQDGFPDFKTINLSAIEAEKEQLNEPE